MHFQNFHRSSKSSNKKTTIMALDAIALTAHAFSTWGYFGQVEGQGQNEDEILLHALII